MPDEYDAVRRDLSNYERGLYFELGRAHLRGETPERGWVRQFSIPTDRGPRILDNAKTQGKGVRSIERKSGRVDARTLEQLKRERLGLESGQISQSGWETVAGEKIDPRAREYMNELIRDFPGRFEHVEISRKDAARAIEAGRALASRQLELIRTYQLDRAERARKRLANIREILRQREAKAAEERAKAERERQAREERARVEREAAERVAREFAEKYKAVFRDREPDENTSARTREDDDAAEKTKQRERDQADEKARQRQREAADRLALEARRARELADNGEPGNMVREVADILHVSRPTPGIGPLHREPPHAGPTRGGREERGRERGGLERTRD
ncbi:hypothetical protein [Nocardia wallacei]|uniref:hypothetical protein n=1 Tax=Nocardia wallacei TaxID=480035 RepID=UPI002456BA10|nr:hypothetical protein [Nocardia wallacei]